MSQEKTSSLKKINERPLQIEVSYIYINSSKLPYLDDLDDMIETFMEKNGYEKDVFTTTLFDGIIRRLLVFERQPGISLNELE